MASTQAPPPTGVRFLVRALRHRNYRLFFGGQTVSLIGTWMTRIAISWVVYELTGSAWLLGLVGFAGQMPTFLLASLGGVWVDRLNRHRVLVITQILSMLQSFALAALALSHVINVWEIAALSAMQGFINAFDMPARQAFVVQMVEEKEDLSNAIALNSSMVNVARLLGPSIAGIIIAAVGSGYCFLLDGFSYLAVIASLLAMRRVPAQTQGRRQSVMSELRAGWSYVSGFAPTRAILLLLALISLVGMPYSVLMPIFATQYLNGGAHTLGFLMGASGCGALFGAVVLAARKSVVGLGRVIAIAAALFGGGLVAFSFSRILWLSLPLMFITGFGMITTMAASNTILQTISPDDKRGRVMSFYTISLVGMAPFGSLLAGTVAGGFSAPIALLVGGSAVVVGAALFAGNLRRLRALVHPIYVGLGIIPEIATGIQVASALSTPPED